MSECCEEMDQAVSDETVLKSLGYFTHGKPRFENDGDNIYDDMTDNSEIKFGGFPKGETC
jgi:hypothetical protein